MSLYNILKISFLAIFLGCSHEDFGVTVTGQSTRPLIIDHSCTYLDKIPTKSIETAKSFKMYYGHSSHGNQLVVGQERIENQRGSNFDVAYSHYSSVLPNKSKAFCVLNYSDNPNSFYSNCSKYLKSNPSINLAMFSWCRQADVSDWKSYLNKYLSEMQDLEKKFPNVIFIYMTGNAQEDGSSGYNRYQFNQALRQFCRNNKKILFDFADIDSWYEGKQNTYFYSGKKIPLEHPRYRGGQSSHTTYESCENKGKALWWLLAKLAGW